MLKQDNKILAEQPCRCFSGSLLLMLAGTYTAVNYGSRCISRPNAPTVVGDDRGTRYGSRKVERLVTFPVETALNGATDVRPCAFILYHRLFYRMGRI
jgi:hypothetical protein